MPRLQDHCTPVVTYPGVLWIRGPGQEASHADHLWEAWEHSPPTFDPLITHRSHSELESLLLPIIIIHKLHESAPRSTQASDLWGYRLIRHSPTHLPDIERIYVCAKLCLLSSR